MRRLSQKILRVLDGSPGAMGGYQRGQSLVELLLITPLLIIMVAGIIEIGWYANHVLILLEVTRVGARQATLFTGDSGYQVWEENDTASIHPIAYKLTNGFKPQKPDLDTFTGTVGAPYAPYPAPVPPDPIGPPKASINARGKCSDLGSARGFYNSVVCSMLDALDPLILKGRDPSGSEILAKRIRVDYGYPFLQGREVPGGRQAFSYKYDELFLYPDDIVVSVFSLQGINNVPDTQRNLLKSDPNLYARTHDFTVTDPVGKAPLFPKGHQVIVVGRYPKKANECNVTFTPVSASRSANPGPAQLGLEESYIEHILKLGAAGYDYADRNEWDGAHTEGLPPVTYQGASAIDAPMQVAGTFKFTEFDGTPQTWMFRDPFEYYGAAFPSTSTKRDIDDVTDRYYELAESDHNAEFQRGFVWTGQHLVDDILDPATGEQLFCIGSEWSDQRVQDTMNSPSFLKKDVVMPPNGDPNEQSAAGANWRSNATNVANYNTWQERAKYLPSQGAVLVELFWRHDILLNFPLMRPVIQLMEGAGGPYNIVISVWAVFPLPSAEPNVNYGFPPKS